MNTREQFFIFNQEQGNPETERTGKVVPNNSKKMSEKDWEDYWMMLEAMSEEEKNWYLNQKEY